MKQIIQQQDALFAFEQFCRLTNHHSDDQTKSRLPPYLSETSRTMKSTRSSLAILQLAQAPRDQIYIVQFDRKATVRYGMLGPQ